MTSPLITAIALTGSWPKRDVAAYPTAQEAPMVRPRATQLGDTAPAGNQERRDAIFSLKRKDTP